MVAEGTDMFAPWGLVGFINMQRYFHPLMIPDTPGDIAAREVRAAPHFHTLPQAERDLRVRAALEEAA